MKKGLKIAAILFCVFGALAFAMGLYMLITINSLALLSLPLRLAYYYIILNKWFMIVGGALLVLGVLSLVFGRKRTRSPIQ